MSTIERNELSAKEFSVVRPLSEFQDVNKYPEAMVCVQIVAYDRGSRKPSHGVLIDQTSGPGTIKKLTERAELQRKEIDGFEYGLVIRNFKR